MNTQTEAESLSADQCDDLASKMSSLILSADSMVSNTMATSAMLGGSPISLSGKMLVAGVLAEIVTHPHDSYDKLKKELASVAESLVETIQLIDESNDPARNALRCFAMREDMRDVIKPES